MKIDRVFRGFGLNEIVVTPITFVSTNYARTAPSLYLPALLSRAEATGVITRAQAESWLANVEHCGRSEKFLSVLTCFRVCGNKLYPWFC